MSNSSQEKRNMARKCSRKSLWVQSGKSAHDVCNTADPSAAPETAYTTYADIATLLICNMVDFFDTGRSNYKKKPTSEKNGVVHVMAV